MSFTRKEVQGSSDGMRSGDRTEEGSKAYVAAAGFRAQPAGVPLSMGRTHLTDSCLSLLDGGPWGLELSDVYRQLEPSKGSSRAQVQRLEEEVFVWMGCVHRASRDL